MIRFVAVGLAILWSGCTPRYTREEIEDRIQWSNSESRDYRASCLLKQPSGVKREEAELYCACKTFGLSVIFRTPTEAESSQVPNEYERDLFLRTGEVPSEGTRYGRVVNICKKRVRQKYGIPEVSLQE
jgi:hypothetical protein